MFRPVLSVFFCSLAILCPATGSYAQADAEPGPPVAIRWWGQGMVSIETWWNLRIVIDPGTSLADSLADSRANSTQGDLILDTKNLPEEPEENELGRAGVKSMKVHCLDDTGNLRELNHYYGRTADDSTPAWHPNKHATLFERPDHAISIRSVAADSFEKPQAFALLSIKVDGVHIVHCSDWQSKKLTNDQVAGLGEVDVMLIPFPDKNSGDSTHAYEIVKQLKPRTMVPYRQYSLELNLTTKEMEGLLDQIPKAKKLHLYNPKHNTTAAFAGENSDTRTYRLVSLSPNPWQPAGELATLLDKMDAACQASQKVFAPLTANQMNWRPPNGSHTPRWNTEHMLGRQLGFFSQIYADIDPAFKHIDLNPKQMPDDYQAAHADWSGAEEARQMQRANAFVRRFAYLLDGVDLDARAPGSRWKLGALLKQMDRHFAEHTANVKKKFELEGWPAE